jgi:Do/DeqQ family serine protease
MDKLKRYSGVAIVVIMTAFLSISTYAHFIQPNKEVERATFQMKGHGGGGVDFTIAAERTVHAVVHVRVKSEQKQVDVNNPFYEFFYGGQMPKSEPVSGFGSGVIVSSDGYIITNNHVIDKADEISVKLNDNREFVAELVGADPSTDLALLKIKAKDLPTIPFGNSDSLKIGQWVLAVGNPFNLTSTVTAGIVSAKARNLNILPDQYRIESFIQTDAALNPGNSGGALVTTDGQLVGINSAILSPSGGYAGNSFAIPVSIVKKVYDDLKEYGVVQRAVLGVSIKDVDAKVAKDHNLDKIDGVLIATVQDDGAAHDAGIKEGDVIVKVNGVEVNNTSELQEQISKYRPKDKISIDLIREGKPVSLSVNLKSLNGDTKIVKKDEITNVLGAKFAEATKGELSKLGLNNGVKVTEVGPGKFRAAGVQKGFIITAINDTPVSSPEDIVSIIRKVNDGVFIKGVYSDGVVAYYAFGVK